MEARPRSLGNPNAAEEGRTRVSARPSAAELLATPGAVLSRTDLRDLGYERRAVDAIFRELPTGHLPGYGRPLIRAADLQALIEERTYDGRTSIRPG